MMTSVKEITAPLQVPPEIATPVLFGLIDSAQVTWVFTGGTQVTFTGGGGGGGGGGGTDEFNTSTCTPEAVLPHQSTNSVSETTFKGNQKRKRSRTSCDPSALHTTARAAAAIGTNHIGEGHDGRGIAIVNRGCGACH
jgi:hypothetical protein